jgi:hypothetical protein
MHSRPSAQKLFGPQQGWPDPPQATQVLLMVQRVLSCEQNPPTPLQQA